MGSDAAGVGHFQRYSIAGAQSEFEKKSPSTDNDDETDSTRIQYSTEILTCR
jgi:hypothetical protein